MATEIELGIYGELRKHPVSQALILVKGSHSIGLERLADLL
jgi:UDP-N-acetylmuramyl pentapeptide synthase